jgi:hypothetical protein
MTPRLRKLALTIHLTSAIGWIGAVLAFLALAVAGGTSQDDQLVRAAYRAMALMLRYALVPLALGALATGLISALGSPWGLFRHYWVLVKLVLTVVAVVVLFKQLESFDHMAQLAADPAASVAALRSSARPLVHGVGGLLVLLVVQVLGVYKPRGLTRYGWRKQMAGKADATPDGQEAATK